MRLTDLVAAGAIIPLLRSQDRDGAVVEMIDALAAVGAVAPKHREEFIARVLEREKRGSTGFGRGVAVPHVKHKSVKTMSVAIGLSQAGIDFSALDKQPVYTIFLLVSPEDQPEDHLRAMEVIFKNLSKDTFRRFLRQAASADDVRSLLEESDGLQIGP
jgi:mannitol/fructose-specific phosphotransferase system IIA component (Ntr-type)